MPILLILELAIHLTYGTGIQDSKFYLISILQFLLKNKKNR